MDRLARVFGDLHEAGETCGKHRVARIMRMSKKDFARSCQTPILVLPDETPAHPLVVSSDVASLCANAEITEFPWRDPPELKARTIEKVRRFLRAHRPAD